MEEKGQTIFERLTKAIRFLWTWSLPLCSGVLLVSATLHILQLDSPGYTSSPLIHVEMVMVVLVALLVVLQPFVAVFLCIKRQWRRIGVVGIKTVLGIASFVSAMHIDSPTLIYMT